MLLPVAVNSVAQRYVAVTLQRGKRSIYGKKLFTCNARGPCETLVSHVKSFGIGFHVILGFWVSGKHGADVRGSLREMESGQRGLGDNSREMWVVCFIASVYFEIIPGSFCLLSKILFNIPYLSQAMQVLERNPLWFICIFYKL